MDTISVIVPVYNVAEYLPNCINSILAQTYSNLQIILVDDGSTDACPEICDNYAQQDSRIQVVHQVNGGLSCARNTGIALATGEYLSFVDSDDYLHPEFYQRLLDAIKSTGADVAVCKFVQVSDLTTNNPGTHQATVYKGRQEIMRNFFNRNCAASVVAVNKLYKRNIFGEHRYKVGIIHEDEELTYKVFYDCSTVVYISDTLYYYYVRENSITTKKYTERNLQIFDILKSVIQFYEEHMEPELQKRAIIRYFKMLQINILRLERECREAKENVSQNEIYQTLRRWYMNDLHKYRMTPYKILFDLYGHLKQMKESIKR